MSGTANDELLEVVDTLPRTRWTGTVYRYTSARRDPMSGAGARLFGGRWNPQGIFAALYFAFPAEACMAEVERAAASQGLTAETLLRAARRLHTMEIRNASVLDLTDPATMNAVGLALEDVRSDDWEACQAVGHAAWFLHFDGVLAPSASGIGYVLALFESRIHGGVLTLTSSEDLTPELYESLKADL